MNELDLRPNSDKSREAVDKTEIVKKDVPKPQLSKGAVKKKPDILSKITSTFLQGRNLQDVGHYVLADVLIPKLIDGLASAGKAAIDGIFYGDGTKTKSASSYGNNKQNYSRISSGGVAVRNSSSTSNVQKSYNKIRRGFENVTIESRMDAENVLAYLNDMIRGYECVSIADFYDAFEDPNIQSQYTDNNWGWFSLDGVGIRHVPGGWIIDLPEPVKLG